MASGSSCETGPVHGLMSVAESFDLSGLPFTKCGVLKITD